MKFFDYVCSLCGPFEANLADDEIQCRCGQTAKRKYTVSFIASSLKHRGRFDPVVGAYVENEAQFNSLLSQGRDAQEQKLGMECKLATVDARDTEGLAELHNQPVEERKEHLEISKRAWAKTGGPDA